ncbi:MAG TPA: tetratricopeptide repeat protein [Sphingomonadaceae bacterium]
MLLAALLPLLAQAAAPPTMDQTKLAVCLDQASKNPQTAIVTASEWIGTATGAARAYPQQCLGVADTLIERWQPAEQAFLAGRGFAAPADYVTRARLAAMAGNAALADGRNDAALADFDLAVADAGQGKETELGGEIQTDRSRALVALGKLDEAAAALEIARRDSPQNAETWLLSATLARRQGDLTSAQARIETAAGLDPKNPDIGLEAGVIAALAKRDDAARKSFQSVIDTAAGTPEAKAAQGYLDQLGPPPQPAPAAQAGR